MVENAKIEKFKCDILGGFQTMCDISFKNIIQYIFIFVQKIRFTYARILMKSLTSKGWLGYLK